MSSPSDFNPSSAKRKERRISTTIVRNFFIGRTEVTEMRQNEISAVRNDRLHSALFQGFGDLIAFDDQFFGDRVEETFVRVEAFRFQLETTSDDFL